MYLPLVGGLLWLRGPRLFTAGGLAVLGPCVATAIGTIVLVLRRGGLPTRLILHHEGIELVTPGQEPLTWSWHVIAEAAVSRVSGRFKIVGKDGTVLYARHYGQLGKFSLVERCAAEINARLARYAGDAQRPA